MRKLVSTEVGTDGHDPEFMVVENGTPVHYIDGQHVTEETFREILEVAQLRASRRAADAMERIAEILVVRS